MIAPRSWRRLSPLTAVLALLWIGQPLGAGQSVSRPYLGITLIDRIEIAPRAIRLRAVLVDLTAPGIRFTLSPGRGSREVQRQTTVAFLEAEHAQVAINAHFFWPWPSAEADSEVLGIAASEGVVYSGFEAPVQSYALLPDAPGFNIDRKNRVTVVHRDPAREDGRSVLEPVDLWTTLAGSAQIVNDGVVTIPEYRDDAHPNGQLEPGGPGQYSNEHSWYAAVNARTAIAVSRDGRMLTLFTVEARGGSLGMTVREVAEMLIADFGAWQALNLDGGGSTSLAIADPVSGKATLLTASSDSAGGRAVGSNLAVFARSQR